MHKYCRLINIGLFLLIFPGISSACEVPVFRYALERWPTEQYVLAYDTTGGVSPELNSALEFLKKTTSEPGGLVNLTLAPGSMGNRSAALSCPLPNGRALEVWSGELTGKAASRMVDSPLRREIASRLGDGQNAVWIFVPSGNPAIDQAALESLNSNLRELTSSLSLPEAVSAIDAQGLPELKVGFSVLELRRDDPDEEILAGMLIASEPDLVNYPDKPLAFPVFGRGRVLYALVGDGINRDNIRDACAFLIGPCACEIKDLSPGMDLLMAVDWPALAGDSWVDRVNGGPLTSLAAFVGFSRNNSKFKVTSSERSAAPVISILAAIAGILAVVALVSFRIVRSSKKRNK